LATVATLSTAVLATPTLKPRASASSTGTLPTVTVKGNAFWTSDSDRFYVQGVDYQPGGSSANEDPLVDESTCTRDIKYFKDLGVNTIRVYAVDNSKNHDACMKALDEAGIYLALDVNNPLYSINREDPWVSYNDKYLQSVFAVIDTFAKYTNTLLFFSGNEVINDDTTTQCAPYVKAVTRDMRAYIQARGYRSIPVGYSAADVDSNRYEMATYMNCAATLSAATSSPSTTTLGAILPPSRSLVGRTRSSSTATTAFPSSSPSTAASRTLPVSSMTSLPSSVTR